MQRNVDFIQLANSGWTKKLQSFSQSQTWWSAASLIHYSFLNQGKTITSEKYVQQINEMQQKLQGLQPELVNRKGPILHDKAWLHISQPMLQKLKN